MKRVIPVISMFIVALAAIATDYNVVAAKAQRFFDNEEWASAGAMYELMLDERPADARTYSHAIVASYCAGDSVKPVSLMTRAQSNLIPFDSIFSLTKSVSFSIGNPTLYERFLLDIQAANPHIARPIDNYLLAYYRFRHNGERIVEYASKLLVDAADTRSLNIALVEGLVDCGYIERAADIAVKIADTDIPQQFDSSVLAGTILLALYNQWGDDQCRRRALTYLRQAYSLMPTPYLQSLITAADNLPTASGRQK